MLSQAPRGTYDLYGTDMAEWKVIEDEIEKVTKSFNFKEIRTPMFEHTELFLRGIGDGTDVVQKEMYTFEDKGGRSITLRPEMTAGVGRAYVEHNIAGEPQPTKYYYVGPCFRYEKPQAGRFRQFTQFGCELYGADSPAADAEVISMAYQLLKRLGINNLTLHLNSLGCGECKKAYDAELKSFLTGRKAELCETCQERLERNPLRVLDCKSPICHGIAMEAPSIQDMLCEDCRAHFDTLLGMLEELGIPYVVDRNLVRGLDYYTQTVFEFISEEIGAQGTVCGGGRYNRLIEELGGAPTPAVGFGMGMERLMLARRAVLGEIETEGGIDLYIAPMNEEAAALARKLSFELRMQGVSAETDLLGRSVKAQMKYANKLGARFVLVLGESELAAGVAQLKNMNEHTETEAKLSAEALLTLIQ